MFEEENLFLGLGEIIHEGASSFSTSSLTIRLEVIIHGGKSCMPDTSCCFILFSGTLTMKE